MSGAHKIRCLRPNSSQSPATADIKKLPGVGWMARGSEGAVGRMPESNVNGTANGSCYHNFEMTGNLGHNNRRVGVDVGFGMPGRKTRDEVRAPNGKMMRVY